MRLDIQRIKASAVRVGDVLCFYAPLRSEDQEVWSILRDGKSVVFNEQHDRKCLSSDYVFITKKGN